MVGRERRRLARAFRVAMAAAAGPAVMMACNGSNDAGDDAVDAGLRDATPAIDATLPGHDAGVPIRDTGSPPKGAADAAKKVNTDAGTPDAFAQGGCYLGGVDLLSSYGVDGAPDGQDTCAYYFGCGLPEGISNQGCNAVLVEIDGGELPFPGAQCWLAQEAGCDDDVYAPGEGGALTLLCNPCFGGGGRRPAGLARSRAACGESAVGAYLAALAFEEDASVTAFERMGAELVTLGAPRELVAAASCAARDEVRHARVMARLARGRGGRVAKARVRSAKARAAVAIAAENAAEGCVRETHGALLARWQAAHAGEGDLRRAFTRIARDEARHAALSWALARWIEPRLDAGERARVVRARARAIRALAKGIDEPDASLARDAGVPTAMQARVLLAAMTRELGLTTSARR